MKKIKAFKINRILMEMKKAKEMFVISCGFLCYLVDKKRNYILFLRLRNLNRLWRIFKNELEIIKYINY